MSAFPSSVNPKYLAAIKKLRLIDDTFFNVCFDGCTECMQLLLRTILKKDDLHVTEVITQRSAHNLYGRSVRFDVMAMDSAGKLYNVEIQRADEGANPKRVRFHTSLIDSREISKGTKYDQFPEIWVIFITENDILGYQLPLYHIERMIIEINEPFHDAAHVVYVNGSYRGTDDLGLLMQDFFCNDPAKMHYPELASRVDFFKNETKGVSAMCEIMKQFLDEGRAEGRAEERKDGIKALISSAKDFSASPAQTVEQLMKRYALTEDEATAAVQANW